MTSTAPYPVNPPGPAGAVGDDVCELCLTPTHVPRLQGVQDYITSETFDLVRDERCGLVSTRPIPADPAKYYPSRYRVDRQKQTGGWRVRRRAAMLQRHFPRGFRGRLLDLGCGTGAFALEMRRRGWTVAVTELNDAVLERMRALGVEAMPPDEALDRGFSAPFDAITCWHVLEHVPHPLALAQSSARMLKEGGLFCVTVPNLASWQARHFGRYWLHLDVPRHLYHFTPETLRALLQRGGMRIVATSTLAVEYDIFGVVQSTLNAVCSRPNVLFERLSSRGTPPAAAPRDVALSYLLAAPIGIVGALHSLVAAAFGSGGTLTATCRRVS